MTKAETASYTAWLKTRTNDELTAERDKVAGEIDTHYTRAKLDAIDGERINRTRG